MDQSALSSRAIRGMYFARQEERRAIMPGLDAVSNFFESDQASENYRWLGAPPQFREWVGGRQAKGLRGQGQIITNVKYEATMEVELDDIRRDKTSQIEARIAEFADQDLVHWASLITTLIESGESTTAYDGQFFFDTDHSEGDSGTQSNDLSIDISTLPTAVHGSITVPSTEELQQCIEQGTQQIQGFLNDQGKPMNPGANAFTIMVPTSFGLRARHATAVPVVPGGSVPNILTSFPDVTFSVWTNPELSWTDRFAIFRTDSPIKALIRQSETKSELKTKAEGSEFEFDNDAWQFGIDNNRGSGFGLWQRACLVTMT